MFEALARVPVASQILKLFTIAVAVARLWQNSRVAISAASASRGE
jgi:hypothetical protein